MRRRCVLCFVAGGKLEIDAMLRVKGSARPLWTLRRIVGTSKPSRTQRIKFDGMYVSRTLYTESP